MISVCQVWGVGYMAEPTRTSIHSESLGLAEREGDAVGFGYVVALWQAGKSTLLRQPYPDAVWVDLLKADEFRRYVSRPEQLREELEAAGLDPSRQVVIDEPCICTSEGIFW